MDENYPETCANAQEILTELGFETEFDEAGNLLITEYDSKEGQEDLFFQSIAHLIPSESYMLWIGEDGEKYAWIFDNKFIRLEPKQKNYEHKIKELD